MTVPVRAYLWLVWVLLAILTAYGLYLDHRANVFLLVLTAWLGGVVSQALLADYLARRR